MPIITLLKVDLGITTGFYDDRLQAIINSAKEMIAREGITLNDSSLEDAQLVVMYAAWLWRRRDSMEGMPRMLRYLLNNRIFSQKMQEE